MNVIVLNKKYNPLHISFKINSLKKSEDVLLIWEDPISHNLRFVDKITIHNGLDYFSGLNKNISFFENGILFKIVSLETNSVLFSYMFKNISFLRGKNIMYISQNSYTGYSYAARNYIYQLLECGYNVTWNTRFTTKNVYQYCNEEEKKVFDCLNKPLNIDSVIIHHTPDGWNDICNSLPSNIHKYGLTTWETTHIHKDWASIINDEGVDKVIVPSKFNKQSFINSGVQKLINVWRHDIFPIMPSGEDQKLYDTLLIYRHNKFIKNSELINTTINSKTVYYNISQFISRKNIDQLIHVFCKKFNSSDSVVLLLKTHLENFNEKENDYIKYKIISILQNYDNPPDVVLCLDNLNDNQINKIHLLSDVYFTLNRGEGFGLCTYTAKKVGNKIICGKFGAEKEFLDDTDVLLDYQLGSTDILDNFNKYYIDDRQQCAYYDTDYVVSKLQYFSKKKK